MIGIKSRCLKKEKELPMQLKKRQSAKEIPISPTALPRRLLPVSLAKRRQTPEEHRQFVLALEVVLAEWVRQHLSKE